MNGDFSDSGCVPASEDPAALADPSSAAVRDSASSGAAFSGQSGQSAPSGEGSGSPGPATDQDGHHFLKNNKYFTICVYAFFLVVVCAVVVRAIFSANATRAFFNGLFRAIAPFLIAILIAYILNPFISFVNRILKKLFPHLPWRPARVISMIIVYIVALGLLITLLVYVLPELVNNLIDLINYIPYLYTQLVGFLEGLQEKYPTVNFGAVIDMLSNVQPQVTSTLQSIAGNLIPVLYTASVSVATWFANALIAIVVSVYILYGRESLRKILKIVLYSLIPTNQIPVVREIVMESNNIFSKYLVSKMTDSLIIGFLCGILMTILRLPYVLLISVIVGVTNMIPYFGPFIGAIPGIIIILCISPIKALVFTIMILALQQFDGLVLGPKLMGSSTGMKPLWIIFAITIGGKFFGVMGMFLGVPVMATLAYLAERYMQYRLRKRNLDMADL